MYWLKLYIKIVTYLFFAADTLLRVFQVRVFARIDTLAGFA